MSEMQDMNNEMLEILKNYFELCSFFNNKLEEINADEVLNMNLKLLKASITDLNINITNFKTQLQYNTENNKVNEEEEIISNVVESLEDNNNPQFDNELDNNELDNEVKNTKKNINDNILAAFFLYLMKIDKDSILNSNNTDFENYLTSNNTSNNTSNTISNNTSNNIYDTNNLDLD